MDLVGAFSHGLGGSPLAIPLAFALGIVTSAGPCAASRFFAVGAHAARSRRPFLIASAFVAGLVLAHVPLGIAAWLLRSAFLALGRYTTFVNLAMAAVLIGAGLIAIVRARPAAHEGHEDGEASGPLNERSSLLVVFAMGVGFAVALGPCCAPPLLAILAATTFVGKPLFGTLLLCVFALGHAVPVFLLGPLAKVIRGLGERLALEQLVSVVSGSVMVFIGGVYALCV